MSTYLLVIFTSITLYCHAQKDRKNEITIGLYGGYFFDKSPFKIQSFALNTRLPTITYERKIGKRFFTGILFGEHDFGYVQLIDPSVLILQDSSLIGRNITRIAVYGGYKIINKPISLKSRIGVIDNFDSEKAVHLYYINQGTWIEGFRKYYDTSGFGIYIGVSLGHPIFCNFFGELSVDYLRTFTAEDKNQLIPSYRIGYRF